LCFFAFVQSARDHFVSRFLYFTTAGVKCRVAAVKSCPMLHFSFIFFCSFEIIVASTIKCKKFSTAQVCARGHEGCCTYSLSLMFRLNQTESAIFMYFVVINASEGKNFIVRIATNDVNVHILFYINQTAWLKEVQNGKSIDLMFLLILKIVCKSDFLLIFLWLFYHYYYYHYCYFIII
jgi:hypothetical protein